MKHILVIDGFIPLHLKLKDLGARLTIMCEVNRLGNKYPDLYDRKIQLPNNYSIEEAVTIATAIHEVDPFFAIVDSHEKRQFTTAKVAQALNLDYHQPETIETIYNKNRMRKLLNRKGIDNIQSFIISDERELIKAMEASNSSFIVKPVDGWASQGIRTLDSLADYQKKKDQFVYPLYIEEQIIGTEYSVEGFSQNGKHHIISITRKYIDESSHVEIGHLISPLSCYEQQETIERFVMKVLDAIGLKDGPSHTEIMIENNDDIHVIETHCRLGGDNIHELVRYATGVDMLELWARHVLGEDAFNWSQMPKLNLAAAIWYIYLNQNGTIKYLPELDNTSLNDKTLDVRFIKSIGDHIRGLENSFSRIGYVICRAANGKEAVSQARQQASDISKVITIE